jgi:ubiquinone/menaquinone biosynthesis C-methylase UbiE
MYRPVHDAVITRLEGVQPAHLLDLGCGTGQLTLRLTERFPDAHVIGIDYSVGMLDAAAPRVGARAAVVQADAQNLPLRPESIDVVVCTESFHWYRNQAQVVMGLASLLRPGGHLLIASVASVTNVGDSVVRQLSSVAGQPIRALTAQRLRRLLITAGFDVVYQRRVPRFGFVPWPVITHARLHSTGFATDAR